MSDVRKIITRIRHAIRLLFTIGYLLLKKQHRYNFLKKYLTNGIKTGDFSEAHKAVGYAINCILGASVNLYHPDDKRRHEIAEKIMRLRDRWLTCGENPKDLGVKIMFDGLNAATRQVEALEARQKNPREITKVTRAN